MEGSEKLKNLRESLYTLTDSIPECVEYRGTLIILLENIEYTEDKDILIEGWVSEYYSPDSWDWVKKEWADTPVVGKIFKAISEPLIL